jgi:hypothetical protein
VGGPRLRNILLAAGVKDNHAMHANVRPKPVRSAIHERQAPTGRVLSCLCPLWPGSLSRHGYHPRRVGLNEDKSFAPCTLFFSLAAGARSLLPDGGLTASSSSRVARPRHCSERPGSARCGRTRLHDRLRQGVCLSSARLQGLTGVGQC